MKKLLIILFALICLSPIGVSAEETTTAVFKADYDDELYAEKMDYPTEPATTTTTKAVVEEKEDNSLVKQIVYVVFFGTLAGIVIFGGIYVYINVSAASKNY